MGAAFLIGGGIMAAAAAAPAENTKIKKEKMPIIKASGVFKIHRKIANIKVFNCPAKLF